MGGYQLQARCRRIRMHAGLRRIVHLSSSALASDVPYPSRGLASQESDMLIAVYGAGRNHAYRKRALAISLVR